MNTTQTIPQDDPGIRSIKNVLLEVSRIAIAAGSSSNRVEALLNKIGATWGYDVESAATPTAIWITIRKGHQQIFELVRVKEWRIDLNKLSRLSYLVDSLYDRKLSLEDAQAKLEEINKADCPYKDWQIFLAGGASCATIMFFYGGSWREIALVTLIGIIIQIFQAIAARSENRRLIADFLSGAASAFYAVSIQKFFPDVDTSRMIVSSLIVLVPGLVFVNAIHEVAQRNLSSGSARLLEAAIIGLSLAFGVAFALGISVTLLGAFK